MTHDDALIIAHAISIGALVISMAIACAGWSITVAIRAALKSRCAQGERG